MRGEICQALCCTVTDDDGGGFTKAPGERQQFVRNFFDFAAVVLNKDQNFRQRLR